MKILASVTILTLLAAVPAPVLAAPPADHVVAFNATVRVDVDASGKPVRVEAPGDLPQAVRSDIEKRVAAWHYEPARHDGIAVPATTFVKVGACALPTPAGDGFRLGLDFKGNGPGLVSATGQLMPPGYPVELRRQGAQGAFQVTFTVLADGTTRVDEVESLDGSRRYVNAFRPVLAAWIEQIRYQPEIVDGHAVATHVSFPVEFKLEIGAHSAGWRKQFLADRKARAIATTECTLAAGAAQETLPVALDSPVKVTPTPAG